MSVEHNRNMVRRYYVDVLNRGDLDVLDQIAARDYVEHDPLPGQSTGLEGLRQRVNILRTAFRARFTIEDLICEGDRVAVRWSQQATHVGDFMGIPATGKPFTTSGIDIHRVSDGRMAEHWHVVDQLGLLQQLGVIPEPDASRAA